MQSELVTSSSNRASNENARERIALQYLDLVYAAAARQTRGDHHAAADITQAVMLVMLEKLRTNRLPEERYMAGWLINITRFAALQAKRAASRRAKHELQAASTFPSVTQPRETDVAIRDELNAALMDLNWLDREVLIRRYLRGETVAEVAAVIGASANTTGRRAARALEKLRKVFASRGVVAPAGAVAAALVAEFAVKAPPACASIEIISQTATQTARAVMFRMVATKWTAFFAIGLVLLSGASVVLAAMLTSGGGKSPGPAVRADAPVFERPEPIQTRVDSVIAGPSEQILKRVLDGLLANQKKLQTIHVKSTTITWIRDQQAKTWLSPVRTQGEAWAEAGGNRRVRDEVASGQNYIMDEQGQFHRSVEKSYVEAWDGRRLLGLSGPPLSEASARSYDTRSLQGESLTGSQYSMQLSWDQETFTDTHTTRKTINQYPLDPAVLAWMRVSARRVTLSGGVDAMELRVANPATDIGRVETFWFDPNQGYALLASEKTFATSGRIVQSIARRVNQIVEASPGVFYPKEAEMDWEQQGQPLESEKFMASSVIANEPLQAWRFNIDFPQGIRVYDFVNGRGTKRQQ